MSARSDCMQRLLVGDLDEDSEEARAFFAAHPDARAELAGLRRAEGLVWQARRERDLDVQLALELPDSPASPVSTGPDVEGLLNEALSGSAGARAGATAATALPRPRSTRGWPVAAATLAAALLAVLLWRPWLAPDSAQILDPGPTLGSGLRLTHPLGEADGIDEFRWEYDLEPGQYFIVSVFDPGDRLHPLTTSPELEHAAWKPDPVEMQAWPDTFEWQVSVMSSGRTVLAQSAVVEQRSP
jgi:hypothetical protein